MIRASAERRARVRPTRRRVSIVAPRRANARWRRAAGARSSRRRVDRVERARVSVIRLVPHHRLSTVRESIKSLSRSGTASREVDAPRRRAFAMRSRSSHPSTRLDSNARPTTGASVRAELEQTPRPPPRLRPSTEHTTTRPTERAIDRSIDRSIDAHPSCRDSPSNRTVFSHTRSHSFRRGGENNPPKNRRDAAPCIHAPSSRTRAGVHTSRV